MCFSSDPPAAVPAPPPPTPVAPMVSASSAAATAAQSGNATAPNTAAVRAAGSRDSLKIDLSSSANGTGLNIPV